MRKLIIIIAALAAAGCKPSYVDSVEACRKAGGSLVKVYNNGGGEYRCAKVEFVQ